MNIPGYYKQCCDEHWGTLVSFPSGFLSVYAQQWDCWIIRQFYFQFFKESLVPCPDGPLLGSFTEVLGRAYRKSRWTGREAFYSLPEGLWANCWTSVNFCFLICKMPMLTIPFQGELSDLIHTNNAWNMAGTVSVFAVTVQEVRNFNG